MAERSYYGYPYTNGGQQSFYRENMRTPSQGMNFQSFQRQGNANPPVPPPTPKPNPPPAPKTAPLSESNPLSALGIKGLDEEKLILIAIIILLAKSGADWVILAALLYIMAG